MKVINNLTKNVTHGAIPVLVINTIYDRQLVRRATMASKTSNP